MPPRFGRTTNSSEFCSQFTRRADGGLDFLETGQINCAKQEAEGIDFSVAYVPSSSVSGPEVTPGGPTGGTIELEMSQFSVSVGWTRKF